MKPHLILASSSSRRKFLLDQLGIGPFKVIEPKIIENNSQNILPKKIVLESAYNKAASIKKKIKDEKGYIIAGDTIVSRSKKNYFKALDTETVRKYLSELSGKKHFVYGGICVISPKGVIARKLIITEVYFNRILKNELNDELLLKDGIGKSGGYGIQGLAIKFIKKIKGSYTNVVGLSLPDLYNILKGLGFKKY